MLLAKCNGKSITTFKVIVGQLLAYFLWHSVLRKILEKFHY